MIKSFDPIERYDAKILILGTLPSAASLASGYNYAHPRNAFWYIMQALAQNRPGDIREAIASGRIDELIEIDPEKLPGFPARKKLLIDNRIALWDCLRSAEREGGSLDSSIDAATEIPNDIPGFLRSHPQIRAVFFNGTKSESVFRRLVAPVIEADSELAAELERRPVLYRRLPSTSPANAGMTPAKKLEAWAVILNVLHGLQELRVES